MADPEQACDWHAKAANGGIPYSNHRLAECLLDGTDRPTDATAAANAYRRAAELGYTASLCALGSLYLSGTGIEQDPARAVELCTGAAGGGAHDAQYRVALLRLEGPESVRDEAEGLHWLEQAARSGHPEAQYRLGEYFRAHAEDDEAAGDTARFWLESAAAQGHLPAYLPTSELYLGWPEDVPANSLPPEHLAKAYLWLNAADRRIENAKAGARVRELLERVRTAMPESWAADLDAKVDDHLAGLSGTEP